MLKRHLVRRTLIGGLCLTLTLAGCGKPGAQDDADEADSSDVAEAIDPTDDDPKDDDAKDGDEEEAETAVPVEVSLVSRGPIESVLRSAANLEAERSVGVFAEASRRVVERLVEEGDVVERGALLARLQDAEQRSRLARAETELSRAQREYDRQKRLQERELTSDQSYNDAMDELERRRIELEDARRELSYTEVRAPIAGTVTERFVKVGDQVQLNQQLFNIIDFESLVVPVYVPEKNLMRLRRGMSARVHARAASPDPYAGSIDRISPVVDPRTGTVKVTVAVGGQRGLRPGMFVDVELITDTRPDAILLPKRALVYDADQVFAFRVSDGRAERFRVVPRLTDALHVEPIEGVAVGDSLVVAGQAGLKDDSLVEVIERESEGDLAGGRK